MFDKLFLLMTFNVMNCLEDAKIEADCGNYDKAINCLVEVIQEAEETIKAIDKAKGDK